MPLKPPGVTFVHTVALVDVVPAVVIYSELPAPRHTLSLLFGSMANAVEVSDVFVLAWTHVTDAAEPAEVAFVVRHAAPPPIQMRSSLLGSSRNGVMKSKKALSGPESKLFTIDEVLAPLSVDR